MQDRSIPLAAAIIDCFGEHAYRVTLEINRQAWVSQSQTQAAWREVLKRTAQSATRSAGGMTAGHTSRDVSQELNQHSQPLRGEYPVLSCGTIPSSRHCT